MNVTMMREEIQELLSVNNNRMKYLIKNNKLEYELNNIGYSIINKYKSGRNTVYELQTINIDEWEQYQHYMNIKKKDEHTEYVEKRLSPIGLASPRSKFLKDNNIGISESSAIRYDHMMLEESVIKLKEIITVKRIKTSAQNVVYRMVDVNDEVIYIGKAEELKKRIYAHSSEEKDNDWFDKEVFKIEYVSFLEYGDCSLAEMYLISKTKPKYNKDFVKWNTSIIIPEFEQIKWSNVSLSAETIQVYDKGEKYEEFIKMLGVDK